MREYEVKVTGRITKRYLIDAENYEDALEDALVYFNDDMTEAREDFDNVEDVVISIMNPNPEDIC